MKLPWWLPFGQVAEIDARALHAQLQTAAAPQIIDVRTTLEWSHSRIGNALSVPVTELKTRLPSLMLDKSRPVVAICLSGHRSIPAVRLLRASGYTACQLHQGMQAWWKAKLPVVSDKEPTN